MYTKKLIDDLVVTRDQIVNTPETVSLQSNDKKSY